MDWDTQDDLYIIIGLGKTGFSVAKYLAARNKYFIILDTRSTPPMLQVLKKELPQVQFISGPINSNLISKSSLTS